MYDRSMNDADAFWAEAAEESALVQEVGQSPGSRLGQSQDRLVPGRQAERRLQLPRPASWTPVESDKVALYFEGDSPDHTDTITYKDLYERVTKFANVLKKQGVKKGDRVSIYLPMIPELVLAMLACARIGAIHCICFGGFSSDALRDRVLDADAKLMITCDAGLRGSKKIPAQTIADAALADCPNSPSASWSSTPVRTSPG